MFFVNPLKNTDEKIQMYPPSTSGQFLWRGVYSHRINFRSSGNYIINDVAKAFGGGGHIYAAGAHVDGLSVKEIEKYILEQLKKKINNGN